MPLVHRIHRASRRATTVLVAGGLVCLLGTGTAATATAQGSGTAPSRPAAVGKDRSTAVGLDLPGTTLPVEATAAEVPDTVTGTILRAYAEIGSVEEDGHDRAGVAAGHAGDEPGLLTWISTDDGLAVKVPTDQLEDLPDGATVQARLGDVQEADGDDPQGEEESGHEVLAAETLDGAETPTGGSGPEVLAASAPRQVTVAMVAPKGQTRDAATLSQVVSAVENGASPFWSQQTGGAVSQDVVATQDWISTKASCDSPFTLWKEVADRIGWTSGAGKHLLLYVTSQGAPAGCYSGLGTVGSGPESGGMSYVRSTSTSIIAHELGHNMGLGHSNGLLCAGTSDGTYGSGWSDGCTAPGYRDWYDVMGTSWSNLGSLNAPHAVAMGALASDSSVDVTAPARATLARMSGLSGLRVLQLVDGTTTYTVEFRPPSGRDSWLSSNYRGLAPGVTVRRTDPLDSRGSLLLDGTPSATVDTSDWDSPIPAGKTLRIASGKFAVKVETVGTDAAQVAVAVDGVWPAPSAAPPVADTTPPPVSGVRGDWTGEGSVDLLGTTSDGSLWLYPGRKDGSVGSGSQVGSGWGGSTWIGSPGDVDGDRRTDLLARRSDGTVWFYPGRGAGGFGSAKQFGSGWNSMTAIATPGDLDGDGVLDLVARRSDGTLHLYRLTAVGGRYTGQIGSGWNGMTWIVGMGDLNGDRRGDVVAVRNDGKLFGYAGSGAGLSNLGQIGSGWGGMTFVASPGDLNADGRGDLVGRNANGTLWFYAGRASGVSSGTQIGSGWNGITRIL